MRAEQEGLSSCSYTEERADSQSFHPSTRLGAATSLPGGKAREGTGPSPQHSSCFLSHLRW